MIDYKNRKLNRLTGGYFNTLSLVWYRKMHSKE